MITEDEVKSLMYKFVNANLKSSLSGNVYTGKRPDSKRTSEDCCISVLSINGNEIQVITVNVNIYVADNDDRGYSDTDREDVGRIEKLCASLFKSSFSGLLYSDYTQDTSAVNATTEHCINNKIVYKFYNE